MKFLIEDAATLGATYKGRSPGTLAELFTRSMAQNHHHFWRRHVSDASRSSRQARFLATHDPAPHYQHSEIGHNHRLSFWLELRVNCAFLSSEQA